MLQCRVHGEKRAQLTHVQLKVESEITLRKRRLKRPKTMYKEKKTKTKIKRHSPAGSHHRQ